MPRYKALKPLRYLNRMMQAGDEFDVMPGDVRWAQARGRAELVAERRGPGRPPRPKAQEPDPTPAEVPWEPGLTRKDLLARAEELGVELPDGYVGKDTLAALVAKAEMGRG